MANSREIMNFLSVERITCECGCLVAFSGFHFMKECVDQVICFVGTVPFLMLFDGRLQREGHK
jgi:hypothetical protein